MKKLIIILSSLIMILSCSIFLDVQYGFWVKNDSAYDIFIILDFNTEDDGITYQDNFSRWLYKYDFVPLFRSDNDGWENYIKDSLYVYYAYWHDIDVIVDNAAQIKEEDLICRITYDLDEIYDIKHKRADTLHFPPRPGGGRDIIYYQDSDLFSMSQNTMQ